MYQILNVDYNENSFKAYIWNNVMYILKLEPYLVKELCFEIVLFYTIFNPNTYLFRCYTDSTHIYMEKVQKLS